jgi:hypothetical protein
MWRVQALSADLARLLSEGGGSRHWHTVIYSRNRARRFPLEVRNSFKHARLFRRSDCVEASAAGQELGSPKLSLNEGNRRRLREAMMIRRRVYWHLHGAARKIW